MMTMPIRRFCCVLSFDYLDYDVFLNVRIFYRLAGYSISRNPDLSLSDLVVVLRGIPPRVFHEYKGTVHFYDYVREHSYDLRKYFPNATEIYQISIHPPTSFEFRDLYINSYLPVIPSLWQITVPFLHRSSKPIHISNYKPLKEDLFQNQLISLIRNGEISVFGAKWERVQISTHPLSYLSANIRLSLSKVCYGLMYPYQRGRSLSGRMWQAPIQGCIVISESNTNTFNCPGVFEVPFFENSLTAMTTDSKLIAREASQFWWEKTVELAKQLNLSLNLDRLKLEILIARGLLVKQHVTFLWMHNIVSPFQASKKYLRLTCGSILRKIK